jgi:hypothetical protein
MELMRKLKTAAGAAVLSALLAACGELEMVLPSSTPYRINALINDYTLDECSIINSNDNVRPYFVDSIEKDPDVTGLMVFLQTLSGEPAGQKTRYTFVAGAGAERSLHLSESGGEPETGGEPESGGEPVSVGESATGGKPSQAPERVIFVNRSKRELPPFLFPNSLAMDHYVLNFQVLREEEILYKTQKPVYFLGDALFVLEDIRSYRPDEAGAYLIPPGSAVLLEAVISADEDLAPYVIWYNGKKIIDEGLFDGNLQRFLWKTPDQGGFLLVRAEVFPFKPRTDPRIIGKSREFSLPVASKKEDPKPTDAAHWYQFQGDLRDTRNPGKTLETGGSLPLWLPHAGIYGLAVGPQDTFTLPGALTGTGRERITIRFAPRSAGLVFSVSHALFGGADLELSAAENGVILSTGGVSRELAYPDLFTGTGFITAHISFQYEGGFCTLEPWFEGVMLPTPEPLTFNAGSGERILRLGGSPSRGNEDPGGSLTAENRVTAIIDEVIITYTGDSR